MELSSAEIHLRKVQEYLSDLLQSDSSLYEKSRLRLKKMAEDCQESINLISQILQEYELTSDVNDPLEDVPRENTDILEHFEDIQEDIQELQTFVSTVTSSQDSKLSSDDCKKAIHLYADTFKKLSTSVSNSKAIHEVSDILLSWFNRRFLDSGNKEFKYNIRKIPSWVESIVRLYALYLDSGETGVLISEMREWTEKISYDFRYKSFAVPSFVHKIDTRDEYENFSLTAVVLWDVLMDMGLRDLCTIEPTDLCLSDYQMFEHVAEHNPSCLDSYRHYSVDRSILDRCGIDIFD